MRWGRPPMRKLDVRTCDSMRTFARRPSPSACGQRVCGRNLSRQGRAGAGLDALLLSLELSLLARAALLSLALCGLGPTRALSQRLRGRLGLLLSLPLAALLGWMLLLSLCFASCSLSWGPGASSALLPALLSCSRCCSPPRAAALLLIPPLALWAGWLSLLSRLMALSAALARFASLLSIWRLSLPSADCLSLGLLTLFGPLPALALLAGLLCCSLAPALPLYSGGSALRLWLAMLLLSPLCAVRCSSLRLQGGLPGRSGSARLSLPLSAGSLPPAGSLLVCLSASPLLSLLGSLGAPWGWLTGRLLSAASFSRRWGGHQLRALAPLPACALRSALLAFGSLATLAGCFCLCSLGGCLLGYASGCLALAAAGLGLAASSRAPSACSRFSSASWLWPYSGIWIADCYLLQPISGGGGGAGARGRGGAASRLLAWRLPWGGAFCASGSLIYAPGGSHGGLPGGSWRTLPLALSLLCLADAALLPPLDVSLSCISPLWRSDSAGLLLCLRCCLLAHPPAGLAGCLGLLLASICSSSCSLPPLSSPWAFALAPAPYSLSGLSGTPRGRGSWPGLLLRSCGSRLLGDAALTLGGPASLSSSAL